MWRRCCATAGNDPDAARWAADPTSNAVRDALRLSTEIREGAIPRRPWGAWWRESSDGPTGWTGSARSSPTPLGPYLLR